MVEKEVIVMSGLCAEEIELTGYLAGIEGEVLPYQVSQTGYDVLFAEKLLLDGF